MARSTKTRTGAAIPAVARFRPQGVPTRDLDTTMLGLDEREALRLADPEALGHEEAAAARERVADHRWRGRRRRTACSYTADRQP